MKAGTTNRFSFEIRRQFYNTETIIRYGLFRDWGKRDELIGIAQVSTLVGGTWRYTADASSRRTLQWRRYI